MKLIPDSSAFDAVNTALNLDTVEGCLIGRLESYSCKMVGQEKALYKKFSRSDEAGIHDLQALSPPRYSTSPCEGLTTRAPPRRSISESGGTSSTATTASNTASNTGPAISSSVSSTGAQHLDDTFEEEHEDKIVRKTLFYLVSTLNAAFYPDYDFSNTSSREFSMEHSLKHVMQSVEQQLTVLASPQLNLLPDRLWTAIDEAVHINDCQIYTYNPDDTSDPYSDDGCLWSFNYFFFNPRLKRIVFFTCRLVSPSHVQRDCCGDYYMDSDMEFDD